MTCDCNCNCPNLGEDCDCNCGCPMQGTGPDLGDGCAPGYTRICPRRGIFCPDDMMDLCPEDMLGNLPLEPIDMTRGETRAVTMESKVTKNIKISGTTFSCKITMSHTYSDVKLGQSDIKCSPSSPGGLTAKQVEFSANGYTFKINANINPTKLLSAKIVSAPKTTTTTTTTTSTTTTSTTTTSTTTTLFNYDGCTCLPDFVLYFSHQAITLNTGLANRAGKFSLPWKTAGRQAEQMDRSGAGPYSHRFTIPVNLSSPALQRAEDRQTAMFMSSCYCIQREGISITGVIMD